MIWLLCHSLLKRHVGCHDVIHDQIRVEIQHPFFEAVITFTMLFEVLGKGTVFFLKEGFGLWPR
jgi:hypothetical protein